MDKFRKTFSVRKKKENEPTDSSKPQLWIEDERKIKEGSCSFQVKYLGCIEVFESRGMQVCEEAIKALRKSKKKAQRAILYVSGDALRVSDEISKHLIVDQTIEKVSFCAPDRGHDKGFAYICRDGATRRWMCHAFLAVKESGERLSHAVGCAFAICLERKQKRERDAVQATYANEDGSFVRMSSFRQTTLSERLLDPQSAIVVDHNVDTASRSSQSSGAKMDGSSKAIIPFGAATLPKLGSGAIPRPRANPSLIERQTSLRLFPKLQDTSPFKHNLSMRVNSDVGAGGALTHQSTNLIMNGAGTILEEPSTELEEPRATNTTTSAANHFIPSSKVSLTYQPSQFAFLSQHVTNWPAGSSTFPVSFEDPNPTSTTAFSTSATAAFTTSVPTSGLVDTSLMALDPFSAAPVNPATIQQHQAAQKQQLQQGLNTFPSSTTSPIPPSRVSPSFKPTKESSPTPKVAAFPVTDWPEPAASNGFKTSIVNESNGHGNASFNLSSADPNSFPTNPPLGAVNRTVSTTAGTVSPTIDVSFSNSAMALFGAEIKSPTSIFTSDSSTQGLTVGDRQWSSATAKETMATALAPWLPDQLSSTTNADPGHFPADPFDLGWAERATAVAQGQLAAISSTLPLPLTATPLQQPSPPPASCTNPFLSPPSSSDGAIAGLGF
nr:protein numb [Hymenolepis microstoma]